MKDLRQEKILEFRPAGVVAGDAIELPADGDMDLDITYSTSANFDLFDSDEDVLALDISLSTRSSELDDGGN